MSGPVAVHRIEDPFEFARTSGRQAGEVALGMMSRLADRLARQDGAVSFEVSGKRDQLQRPMLELKVAGSLQLQCGRCLGPLQYRLELRSRVLLAKPGEVPQDDDDPETPEWIEAGRDLDLVELVEEEILLGLPLSVRHDREECRSGRDDKDRDGGTHAPFSQLSELLGSRRKVKR